MLPCLRSAAQLNNLSSGNGRHSDASSISTENSNKSSPRRRGSTSRRTQLATKRGERAGTTADMPHTSRRASKSPRPRSRSRSQNSKKQKKSDFRPDTSSALESAPDFAADPARLEKPWSPNHAVPVDVSGPHHRQNITSLSNSSRAPRQLERVRATSAEALDHARHAPDDALGESEPFLP